MGKNAQSVKAKNKKHNKGNMLALHENLLSSIEPSVQ
jgi:hypothetical protein